MNNTLTNIKIEKAIKLHDYLSNKEDFHEKKWHRARKSETQDFHYKTMRKYSKSRYRCMSLVFRLRNNEVFGVVSFPFILDPVRYLERKAKRKAEAKKIFDNRYRVQLWFYSESLTADYGTHHCEKCNRKYHHSPSTVFLGAIKEYESICGYCVNNLLDFNRQETIFI